MFWEKSFDNDDVTTTDNADATDGALQSDQ